MKRMTWKQACAEAKAKAGPVVFIVAGTVRRVRRVALAVAEAERDAALVAGAVLLSKAREALRRIADGWRAANGGCLICQQADGQPHREACPAPEVDDALRPLDGGGDVREWAIAFYKRLSAQETHTGYYVAWAEEFALASPPALPDATEALREHDRALAKRVVEACALEAVARNVGDLGTAPDRIRALAADAAAIDALVGAVG